MSFLMCSALFSSVCSLKPTEGTKSKKLEVKIDFDDFAIFLLLTVNRYAGGDDLLGRLIVTLIDLKFAWTPNIVPLYLLLLFHKCS